MPPRVIPLRSLLPVESESISRMPCQPFWALVLIIMISTKAQACKLLVGGVKFNCHTRTHTHTYTHTQRHTKAHIRHVGSGILYAKVSETNSIFKPTPWNCFPSLFLCFYLCLFFLLLLLFYISTFVVHDIDTIAQSLPLCVCLCAAWLPSEPLSRPRLHPSTLPFTPWAALPYGNRWQLGSFGFGSSAATSQNAPQWDFLIGFPIKANIFNFISIVTLATLLAVKAKGNSLRSSNLKKNC